MLKSRFLFRIYNDGGFNERAMYRTLLVGVGLSEGNLICNLELSGRLVPENNQFGWVLNMHGMMPSVRTE